MGGAMRRIGRAAREFAVPAFFALALPMCAPAAAMPGPKKPKINEKAQSKEEKRERLEIYAMLRASAGKMMRSILCRGMHERLPDPFKSKNKPSQDASSAWIGREIRILRLGRGFDLQTRLDISLASLLQNIAELSKVYQSEKKLAQSYLDGLTSLGFPETGFVRQWLKKGNKDINSLYRRLSASCQPSRM